MKITPAFNLLFFILFLGVVFITGCARVHVHVDVLENSNLQCSVDTSSPLDPKPKRPPPGPGEEKKIFLTIKKHQKVELTEDETRRILEQAMEVANTDGQCNLQLVRKGEGEIENFTWPQEGPNPGVVSSQFDFDVITGLPGVKVIEDVQFCGRPGPFVGCAELPGDSFVVEMLREKEGAKKPFYQTLGVLWLHELGHNKGIFHRLDSKAVMNPQVFFEHKELIRGECSNFKVP